MDGVAGKSFIGGEQCELAIQHTDETFRCADPKRARPIGQECANVVALELRSILLIEKGKSYAVEAVAGNFVINDPRTTTLAQPLSIYGGIRYTFGEAPAPMPEPLVRKF